MYPTLASGAASTACAGGSGNWSHVVRPFLSAETTAALRPLGEVLYDGDPVGEEWCVTVRRFFEIAYSAVLQTRIPVELRTSDDLLFWAEHGDALDDQAQVMLRTVDPERFQSAFPEYRQLASATTRSAGWPCPHQPQHPDVPAL
jgi:hypothetical protein